MYTRTLGRSWQSLVILRLSRLGETCVPAWLGAGPWGTLDDQLLFTETLNQQLAMHD